MDILYIALPELSDSFASVRQALRSSVKSLPETRLTETTLAAYGSQYQLDWEAGHLPHFDLIIAECLVKEFTNQLRTYEDSGKNLDILLADREVWKDIVQKSATAALVWAGTARATLLYVYNDGPLPGDVTNITVFHTDVAFRSGADFEEAAFVESAYYRVARGQRALPVKQRTTLQRRSRATTSGLLYDVLSIPEVVSQVVAETFEDVSQWIFSCCVCNYDANFQAAMVLCLAAWHAHTVATEQLEGIPLQFQCVIVSSRWWKKNGAKFRSLFDFKEPKPLLSMKEASQLRKLVHFSDGYSTLFVLTTDGQFQALITSGVNDQYTRRRLDTLLKKFKGVVITTDVRRQVWMHAQRIASPIVFANNCWRIDPSSKPVGKLAEALKKRGMPTKICTSFEAIVQYLSDEHIGGFLVFHEKTLEAAGKVNASQLREDIHRHSDVPIDVEKLSLPALVRVLSLDGAHFIDYSGNISPLCQHLDPPAQRTGLAAPGTKHATAEKVAFCLRDAIVVVISHDGPVTVYADGIKALADREEPY